MLRSYPLTVIGTPTNTFHTETYGSTDYIMTYQIVWKKKFFTIDTRNINYLGPPKLRTDAKNGKEQVCYFNLNKKDKIYEKFLAVRKETSAIDIIFFIEMLIDSSNNTEKRKRVKRIRQ